MRFCRVCGAQNEDNAVNCVGCGYSLDAPEQQYDNAQYAGQQYNNAQYTGQQYSNAQYAGQQYNNAQYTGQQYSNAQYAGQQYNGAQYAGQQYNGAQYVGQQYNNAQYTGQQYSNAQQQYDNIQQNKDRQKEQNRDFGINKKILITGGSAAVVVIVAIILLLVFVWTPRGRAKDEVRAYVEYIEGGDIRSFVEMTASKKLLKDVLKDYLVLAEGYNEDVVQDIMDDFNDDYYDIIDELEEGFDEGDFSVELKNFDIKGARKANLKNVIREAYDTFGTDEIEGYTVDTLYDEIEKYAERYDLNLNKIYIVDASFKLQMDSRYFDLDDIEMEFEEEIGYDSDADVDVDFENTIDHFYVYEYDGETYVIPGIEDLFIEAFSDVIGDNFEEYQDKNYKKNDISSAKKIKTAVEATMGNESAYESLVGTYHDKYVIATKEGLNEIGERERGLIIDYLDDDFPKVKYTKEGYTDFAFMVDENGNVRVYVTNGSDYLELAPEADESYRN